MFSRTMMLALGKDISDSIALKVEARKADLIVEANAALYSMMEEGITSQGLIRLAAKGKTLSSVERASSNLTYFNENFSTGGVKPEDRPSAIRRRRREERERIAYDDKEYRGL